MITVDTGAAVKNTAPGKCNVTNLKAIQIMATKVKRNPQLQKKTLLGKWVAPNNFPVATRVKLTLSDQFFYIKKTKKGRKGNKKLRYKKKINITLILKYKISLIK